MARRQAEVPYKKNIRQNFHICCTHATTQRHVIYEEWSYSAIHS